MVYVNFLLILFSATYRLHLDNIEKLQNAESEKHQIGEDQHTAAVEKFGFPTTTCCGYIAQNNDWHDDWVVSVADGKT